MSPPSPEPTDGTRGNPDMKRILVDHATPVVSVFVSLASGIASAGSSCLRRILDESPEYTTGIAHHFVSCLKERLAENAAAGFDRVSATTAQGVELYELRNLIAATARGKLEADESLRQNFAACYGVTHPTVCFHPEPRVKFKIGRTLVTSLAFNVSGREPGTTAQGEMLAVVSIDPHKPLLDESRLGIVSMTAINKVSWYEIPLVSQ